MSKCDISASSLGLGCGCEDSALTTIPVSLACDQPQACSETFSTDCVIYNGVPVCNVNPGDNLSTVLAAFLTCTAGITTLNGQVQKVQAFATSTNGVDFSISSLAGVHTFNIPTAGIGVRGLLSSTDWTTFNNKQNLLISGTNIHTINGNSLLGYGDLSISTLIGYTPENVTNKATSFGTINNTLYPSVQAVSTWVGANYLPLPSTITAGTFARITYDSHGLVLSGSKATLANDLSDVVISSPSIGNVLQWNGIAWVNGTSGSSGGVGSGVNFFLYGASSGIGSYNWMEHGPENASQGTWTQSITTGTPQYIGPGWVSNVPANDLGTVSGGIWSFNLYLAVSSAVTSTVDVEVYSTYSDGSSPVLLFTSPATINISNVGSPTLYNITTTQPSFTVGVTDLLLVKIKGTTSGTGITFTVYHSGTSAASFMSTPLIIPHNDLTGLQGGSAGQYYHLTSAQAVLATQYATTSQGGLLSSTDWNTFTNKQTALSGTGFVKISGTTISYDNSSYLTTVAASSTYVPYSGATAPLNLGAQDLTINEFIQANTSSSYIDMNYAGSGQIALFGGAHVVGTFAVDNNAYINNYLRIGVPTSTDGSLHFANGSNNYQAAIQATAFTSSYTLTLPVNAGLNGQALTTNGSGALSWVSYLTSSLAALDYVPYTGGNSNVTLGAYSLTATGLTSLSSLISGVSGTTTGSVVLESAGSNAVTLIAPASGISSSFSLILPHAQSTGNQALTNDGSGNLSWVTYVTSSALSSYVPYTGATADLQLGLHNLSFGHTLTAINGNYIDFDYATSSKNAYFNIQGGYSTFTGAIITTTSVSAQGGLIGGATGGTVGTLALYGNSSNLLTFQPATGSSAYTLTFPSTAGSSGQALTTDGSGVLSWTIPTISLTSNVSGILPLANGGTNAALTASNGGIVYSNATQLQVLAGTATAGLALVSGSSATPSWFSPTAGSIIYAGASGVLSQSNSNFFWDAANHRLGIGTNAPSTSVHIIQSTSGALTLADGTQSAGFVLTSDANGVATWQSPSLAGFQVYYLQSALSTSPFGSDYQMLITPQTSSTVLPGVTTNTAYPGTLVDTFVTNLGYPSSLTIPEGIVQINVHAAATGMTGSGAVYLYGVLSEYTSTNTLVGVIGTSGNSSNLTSSIVDLYVTFILGATYTMASSSNRIVLQIYAVKTGTGASPTTTISVGGVNDSHIALPALAININGIWNTTGNAGTTAGTNFLGTTDGTDVVIKANSAEIGRFLSGAGFRVTGASSVSANYSFQVKNSSGSVGFAVTDGKNVALNGAYNNSSTLLTFNGLGNSSSTFAFVANNTSGANTALLDDTGTLGLIGGLNIGSSAMTGLSPNTNSGVINIGAGSNSVVAQTVCNSVSGGKGYFGSAGSAYSNAFGTSNSTYILDLNGKDINIRGTANINLGTASSATGVLNVSTTNSRVGINIAAGSATAQLHLSAGTAVAGTAPLKFNSGTNLTSVEAGAMEYDGTNLYFSPSSSRYTVAYINGGQTFTSAIWNGTAIGPTYGGTGQTTYTTGDMLYASGTNALSKLAIGSTGQVLTVSGGVPTWAAASGWSLTGNSGTTPGTNFLGTTDAKDVVIKSNSVEIARAVSGGGFQITGFGSTTSTVTLKVQNSSSTATLIINDGGYTGFGIVPTNDTKVQIQGNTSGSISASLRVYNSSAFETFNCMDNGGVGMLGVHAPGAGYLTIGAPQTLSGINILVATNGLSRASNGGGEYGWVTSGYGNYGNLAPGVSGATYLDNTAGGTTMISSRGGNVILGSLTGTTNWISLATSTGVVTMSGQFKYTYGSPVSGNVLTSDASGNASWGVLPTAGASVGAKVYAAINFK